MNKLIYSMHRHLYLPLLLLALGATHIQAADGPFRLSGQSFSSVTVGMTFNQSDSIRPFTSTSHIKALGITGQLVRKSQDYLVRVLLKDAQGKEYLVLESYKGMDDTDVLNLENYGQETLLLNNIQPVALKVFVKNAELRIDGINMQAANGVLMQPASEETVMELRRQQAEAVAEKINAYNTRHDKLWRAGVTPLSLMNYERRKEILGSSDDASTLGFEYYTTGIFEVGEPQAGYSEPESKCIDHFDWRNRHGKNWITPAKDQGNSGYCVPFAAVSTTEAMANLYYNQNLNLDLSEQKVACCSTPDPNQAYHGHMGCAAALSYLETNGTCDEQAYPFEDNPSYCKSDEITPNVIVTIKGREYIEKRTIDDIKKALIKKGPLLSGISATGLHHAMSLIGYKPLAVGDTAYVVNGNYTYEGERIIQADDPRIGMTCWIFKDNYSSIRECFPMIFHTYSAFNDAWAVKVPVNVSGMSDKDVVCEDADGDGYYYWGLGPKPVSCPPGVPDEPDGDDSDPMAGPMDEYGYLKSLDPAKRDAIQITAENNTYACAHVYNHIVVENTTWTVKEPMIFHNGATVTVKDGATLVVNNGAVLKDIRLVLEKGAHVIVDGQSILKMLNAGEFSVPVGATLDLNNGIIK